MQCELMSRNKQSAAPLSRRENQIMDILFTKGECTVIQITEAMPDELSRNAIRTFLTILEGKKHISRRKEGREFLYSAVTDKESAAQNAMSKVLDVFFNGSLSTAVAAQFTNADKIKEDELEKLQKLIDEARNQKK